MRSIILALLLAFPRFAVAGDAGCGPDYPANLPCLLGATHTPHRGLEIPGIDAKIVVLTYKKSKIELFAEFTGEAGASGWDVSEREDGNEPDGIRYRSSMNKDGVSIGFSVYGPDTRAVLQLTIFAKEE